MEIHWDTEIWKKKYKHPSELITEGTDITIVDDFAIQKDRKIKINRLDVVV